MDWLPFVLHHAITVIVRQSRDVLKCTHILWKTILIHQLLSHWSMTSYLTQSVKLVLKVLTMSWLTKS